MNPALPAGLKARLDGLLEGKSRTALAERAQRISALYRAGGGSQTTVTDADDALAYAVARMPATYAVAARVMGDVRDALPDWVPSSLLDVGAGPGTASWAACETWPALGRATLLDSNPHFRALAQHLSPMAEIDVQAFDLSAGQPPDADLVVAGYVLAEIPAGAQGAVVEKLLRAALGVVVLIEPGTPDGFARIRAARARAIEQGWHIAGPCIHAATCPMTAPDWCHFSQRLPRSRDHMRAKDASVPYEDERYAWLALTRREVNRRTAARVLAPPNDTKPGIELKLCTAGGIERRFVTRRDKPAFAVARKLRWGDVL